MPLDFPNTPTLGQQFNVGGIVWTWDGVKWTSVAPTSPSYLLLTGGTMSGPINMGGSLINGYSNAPLVSSDVANKGYVDVAAGPINALNIGFVNDGVTDNTASFAAMLARTDSARIYFPKGVYVLSPPTATIQVASNISIIGAGRSNTIFRYPANTSPTTHLYSWNTKAGFTIRDFTLDLNGLRSPGGRNNAHGHIFSFTSCSYVDFDGVAIINGWADGGVTDGTYGISHISVSTSSSPCTVFNIRNCLFTLATSTYAFGRGIIMSQTAGFPITSCHIENNVLINTNGIQMDGSYNIISGNEVTGGWCSLDDSNGWIAGHADAGHSIFIGNYVHDGALGLNGDSLPSVGFTATASYQVYSSNVVERMGGPGFINFGNNILYSNNRVVGCGRNTPARGPYDQAGFRLPSGTPDGTWTYGANPTFIGNICMDDGGGTQRYGYYEAGNVPGSLLRGNIFTGVTAPIFVVSSTTVVDEASKARTTALNLAPAATTSISPTLVMAGLGVQITPVASGVLDVRICCIVRNNAVNNGVILRIRYGTGTPPTNGVALTGTASGTGLQSVNGAGGTPTVPVTLLSTITGLTQGTTYWIDLAYAALTGGTVTLNTVDVLVTER